MAYGKKVTVFLEDGLPKWIREAALDQWSGRWLCVPRNRLEEVSKRPALCWPCVYLLIGESEETSMPLVYVGEADPFSDRIRQHKREKDWWDQFVVFYSTSGSLTKAGIQYLESRCIQELEKSSRSVSKQGNKPNLPSIPREDVPGLDLFLENIKLLLPMLGYDLFMSNFSEEIRADDDRIIHCDSKWVSARAIWLPDGKVRVLKGSTAVLEMTDSFKTHNYRKLRDELIANWKMKESEWRLVFQSDYDFNNLSPAAAVILASPAQGPKKWKAADWKTVG